MTSLYTATKETMDSYADMPCYTVYELKDNGVVFTAQFSDKSDAKSFVRKYGSNSSTLYIYKPL